MTAVTCVETSYGLDRAFHLCFTRDTNLYSNTLMLALATELSTRIGCFFDLYSKVTNLLRMNKNATTGQIPRRLIQRRGGFGISPSGVYLQEVVIG